MALKIKGVKKSITTKAKDPNLLVTLGLWNQYQMLDVTCQAEGYEDGDIKVIHGEEGVVVYIDLADLRHELSIPKGQYQGLIDLGALGGSVEEGDQLWEVFNELRESINGFFTTVAAHLFKQFESPTMQLIANIKKKDEKGEPTGEIGSLTANYHPEMASLTVCHTVPELEEDPEIGAKELKDSLKLYEPVFGTGYGSRYHTVVITANQTKIAARYKGTTLSLKAEITSEEPTKNVANLKSLAFSLKTNGHFSVHYSNITEQIAQQTLWAVAACFPSEELITGLPSLSKFKNQGM